MIAFFYNFPVRWERFVFIDKTQEGGYYEKAISYYFSLKGVEIIVDVNVNTKVI